jgi:hypothetical protein
MLKFCYTSNGRHARTHLTIDQEDFVELFDSAMEKNVFKPEVLKGIYKLLKKRFDQGPSPRRPRLRGVFSNPNCATALDTHSFEPYGRLRWMA